MCIPGLAEWYLRGGGGGTVAAGREHALRRMNVPLWRLNEHPPPPGLLRVLTPDRAAELGAGAAHGERWIMGALQGDRDTIFTSHKLYFY